MERYMTGMEVVVGKVMVEVVVTTDQVKDNRRVAKSKYLVD